MPFDAKSFKPLDWAVVATGLISFIALFLPWWGVTYLGFSATVSGWNTSYGWLGALLVIAAAVWFALSRSGTSMPRLPVGSAVAALGVTAVGLVIIVIRWASLPRFGRLGHTFNYGGRAGIWIAAIAAAVQVGVLVAAFRQSGEELPWGSGRGSGTSA